MTLGPEHLHVGKAEQVTFLEVAEQGTEAAAATGLSLVIPRDAVTARARLFRLDRPFLFMLHDTMTGLMLFIGQIAHPESPA
jgi:serpin B